jgi:hypothetical protein
VKNSHLYFEASIEKKYFLKFSKALYLKKIDTFVAEKNRAMAKNLVIVESCKGENDREISG